MAAFDHSQAKTTKPTLAGQLADRLRAEILEGRLEPGARLNLDRLREGFGVSVSSLREAVTRLVADGLIVAEEQKGYSIAPVSLANLAEITRLRIELEPVALKSAIALGTLDWETDVMAALYRLNRTDRSPGDRDSVETWESAHNAYHRALIDACAMPLLLRFIHQLHSMNDRYRRIFLKKNADQRDVAEEHTAIAEAAVARRGDEAAALLERHLERTGETLRQRLTDSLPESNL
ncbi:MAG: GntR family transcriptional regulator [Pseudooceanicola sp.]|nr:GntR family transcriptional regulator [Pseudooceanicola sp.]